MRKWGPLIAGFFVFSLVFNLFFGSDADVSEPTSSPTQSQTQSARPTETESPAPSAEAEPSATESSQPEQTAEPEQSEEASAAASEEAEPEPTAELTQTASPVATEPAAQDDELAQLLASLRIAAEVTSGYDRDLFRHWIDADGDGCNTRREVLIAEAIEPPTIGDRCELIGGLWYSAFDGQYTEDDSSFDVDHMVPLKEAWDSGANAWSSDRRRAFANDLDLPQSLIAVSASSNRSKSDRDPADWLPPLASYRCQYVEDWVRVKVKWELSVDEREFSAIRNVLASC